jgi:hypothetical protein
MDIGSIHSFLIHPGKSAEEPREINGASVPMSGKLFGMLKPVFAAAEEECPHNIAFVPEADGKQKNECRDCLIAYMKDSDLQHGREVAKRLQCVTTHRSGLGLLFLMIGKEASTIKFVVSRFPADSGILAEEKAKGLTVEFLERIFMKSATSYKAAVYSGSSYTKDFWKGKAADKQINSAESYIADYWIRDFLRSDFLTPGEAGTRRFAIAVRETMNRCTDPGVKMDAVALHHLVAGMSSQVVSAKKLLNQFHVPDSTQEQIKAHFPRAKLFDENFSFVPDEFLKHVAIRIVELDNGGILAAKAEHFDDVFTREVVNPPGNLVRFSTQGRIVDQRFRKVRP